MELPVQLFKLLLIVNNELKDEEKLTSDYLSFVIE